MKPGPMLAAAFLALISCMAGAAEIRLFASGALKEAYVELIPAFEKASGHTVRLELSSTTEIRRRVSAGERHDVVILGDSGTEALIREGRLAGATRTAFAKSGISVAVRAGAPRPDLGSAAAVRQALLAAKSVCYSQGASGSYLVEMFRKLGIYDQVTAKAVVVGANIPVGDKVAAGIAEIGLHQLSELLPVKGIDIVGPLPPELQYMTVFSGAIHEASKEREAAHALMAYLTSPEVRQALRQHGLEPG